jgi:exo-beta-1,3-glucanase (GH17 family)
MDEAHLRLLLHVTERYTLAVRSYGSTNGLEHIGPLAHERGLYTAIGAWIGRDRAANERELAALIELMLAGHVDLAIVGSEALLRGDVSEDELIGYIQRVKAAAPGIPVATADVYGSFLAHPGLASVCDFLMPNYFPYWEAVPVEEAVAFVRDRHRAMSERFGRRRLIISETGWPSAGDPNGGAVPSPENAASYFRQFVSWAHRKRIPYFYFSAFDEPFKALYEGEVGAHWGLWDSDLRLKPGMARVFKRSRHRKRKGDRAFPTPGW